MLHNGLVNNIEYYRKLPNGHGYVLTIDGSLNFSVREIFIEDYLILDDGEWLCDFIVDHCIHIFNKKTNSYQIISVAKSSIIFGKQKMTEEFLNGINFRADKVVFPVNTGNHYVLVVACISKIEVLILDPLGRENVYSLPFKTRFEKIIKIKGLYTKPFKMEMKEQTLQEDTINCGIYVIHFFFLFSRRYKFRNAN